MKNSPRFFVPTKDFSNDQVAVYGSDVAHIRTVLRLKSGDYIYVLDGKGFLYSVQLCKISQKVVYGQIVSRTTIQTEPPVSIKMGQAIIKGNKLDGVVRKAVELGVGSIVLLQTERTVVKVSLDDHAKRHQRWQKIAGEASKQCGRSVVPSIGNHVMSIEQFCAQCQDYGLKLVFWENEQETKLADLVSRKPITDIAFLIGPEGGMSLAEVETARSYGFNCVTLGPRKLRAETVSLAVLSIIQNLWGDF